MKRASLCYIASLSQLDPQPHPTLGCPLARDPTSCYHLGEFALVDHSFIGLRRPLFEGCVQSSRLQRAIDRESQEHHARHLRVRVIRGELCIESVQWLAVEGREIRIQSNHNHATADAHDLAISGQRAVLHNGVHCGSNGASRK